MSKRPGHVQCEILKLIAGHPYGAWSFSELTALICDGAVTRSGKSAHGRITAFVLAGLPPTVALLLFFINPEQMKLLITDPLGQRMLMGAAAMQVVGTLVIRRLVDLKY